MLDKDVVNLIHYLHYYMQYDRHKIETYFGQSIDKVFDCSNDTTPEHDAEPYSDGKELPQQLRNFIKDVDAQLARPPEHHFMFGFPICSEKPRMPGKNRPAFMAMPFKEPWLSDIAPVVTKIGMDSGFDCASLVDGSEPGSIIDQIWQGIRRSDVVVADLSDHNPNVLYELGLSRALGKPSIIIIWKGQKVPFDIAHDRFFEYDPSDLEPLKKWLKGAFNRVPWRYEFDKN